MNRCPPAHGLKRTAVRGHAWSIGNELKYIVRYWSGQQKRATCFATLPQNELKSDFTRFSAHVHTCLVALSGCPGCVKLFQKVESTPSFCNKICSCCSVILPAQVKLACSKWRNSCVWPGFPVILSSEKSVFTPATLATLATLCCKTGLNVGGETCNIAFQLVLQECAKQVASFCCPFSVALATTKIGETGIWRFGNWAQFA